MIVTERLLLRLPRLADAPGLLDAFADPEAMRYIGEGSTTDLAGSEAAIARWLERWDSWAIGMFVVERREDERVLGRAGFLRWDPQTWEIGGAKALIRHFLDPELKTLPARFKKFRANRSMRDVEPNVNLWLKRLDNTDVEEVTT